MFEVLISTHLQQTGAAEKRQHTISVIVACADPPKEGKSFYTNGARESRTDRQRGPEDVSTHRERPSQLAASRSISRDRPEEINLASFHGTHKK